jgi:hypothetical protein
MEGAEGASRQRAFAINRTPDAIDDATHEGIAHIDACRAAGGSHFAAGVDFLHLSEWHEEHAVVAEANDLRLQATEAWGADFADVAEGNIRANGFDDESRDLHDFAHSHQWCGGFNAAPQVFHERRQNGRSLVHLSERATL